MYILGGRGDGGSSVIQCRVIARDYFERLYIYIHIHISTHMYLNIPINILGGRGDGGSSVFQCRVVARDYFECGPLARDYPRIWYGYVDMTHCNTLQHTATHCNTLQHTIKHIIRASGMATSI